MERQFNNGQTLNQGNFAIGMDFIRHSDFLTKAIIDSASKSADTTPGQESGQKNQVGLVRKQAIAMRAIQRDGSGMFSSAGQSQSIFGSNSKYVIRNTKGPNRFGHYQYFGSCQVIQISKRTRNWKKSFSETFMTLVKAIMTNS
jgi:hypothetical protein